MITLTQDQYTTIISGMGKQVLEELLTSVVHQAVEEALRCLPGVMKSLAVQASYVQKLNTQFYKDHRDLEGKQDLVLKTLEQVEGDNPGLPYDKVLEKTAEAVRKVVSGIDSLPQETIKPSLDQLDHLANMFEE